MNVSITFPIDPVAKARPRLGRNGVYTPAKTRRFETTIRLLAFRFHKGPALTGSLKVGVRFVMKAPKRMTNEKPVCRPDLDNLLKGVTDALNGVFWIDDSQITEVHAVKVYDLVNKTPRIELTVEQLQ